MPATRELQAGQAAALLLGEWLHREPQCLRLVAPLGCASSR